MAIFGALLAWISRQAGNLLNTVFGWATTMLFGKVPQDRQIYLSIMTFGSVIWLVTLLGIAFPWVGTLLLTFVPLPGWADQAWVRLAMAVAAVLLPAVVGFVSLLLRDPEERPQGVGATAKAVARGYPFTLGLALTLITMTVFAPIMKIQDIARRWVGQHMPIIVEPGHYPRVVADLQEALEEGGIQTRREQANWMLRFPSRVLSWFSGRSTAHLVADELTTLKSDRVEVLLHPSDLVIRGKELDAAHARAVLAERLTFTRAYLTWDEEATQMEDRLRSLWEAARKRPDGAVDPTMVEKFRSAERDLRSLQVPYEEWEVLFREKLAIERSLLEQATGGLEEVAHDGKGNFTPDGRARHPHGAATEPRRWIPGVAAIAALAAVGWFRKAA